MSYDAQTKKILKFAGQWSAAKAARLSGCSVEELEETVRQYTLAKEASWPLLKSLSTRAFNIVLSRNDCLTREAIEWHVTSGAWRPGRPKGYGEKTHREIVAWLEKTDGENQAEQPRGF